MTGMSKKQEYEQLCRIRNLLLIVAILLAFASAVVGVMCFTEENPDETQGSMTEATESTQFQTEEVPMTSEVESAPPEETAEETTETAVEETAQETAEGTESVTEPMEQILDSILHDGAQTAIQNIEISAKSMSLDDAGAWKIDAAVCAENWYEKQLTAENSEAIQQQMKESWQQVCECWDLVEGHSAEAEKVYSFLGEFFSVKHTEGGGVG